MAMFCDTITSTKESIFMPKVFPAQVPGKRAHSEIVPPIFWGSVATVNASANMRIAAASQAHETQLLFRR
jgi:hypothetical protein